MSSSTSAEDSPSDHESSSDTTLHEVDGIPPYCHGESVTVCGDEHNTSSSAFFPFHLIAGCSTAQRGMCPYSRTITSRDLPRTVELKGTSLAEACGTPTTLHRAGALNPELPSSLRARVAFHTTRHAGTKPTNIDQGGLTVLMTAPPAYHDHAERNGVEEPAPMTSKTPVLAHRMKHDKSILALAVSSQFIFAGTQGGEILVWNMALWKYS
jgi:di- and tripeptidase